MMAHLDRPRDDDDLPVFQETFNFQCKIMLRDFPEKAHLGRGKLCSHFQCFDLEVFFSTNNKRGATWKCPVCTKRAFEVVRDEFFEKICRYFKSFPGMKMSSHFDINTDLVIKTPNKLCYKWKDGLMVEHKALNPAEIQAKPRIMIDLTSDNDE